MNEISKLGDINTVNDFFEYKLSIKTILVIIFVWGTICFIFLIIAFGGINNATNYMFSILNSIKTTLIEVKNKNKNTGNSGGNSVKQSSVNAEDESTEKNDGE